ncbi:unnamed protein product, partial [Discosporangium mesarthrocarpum]
LVQRGRTLLSRLNTEVEISRVMQAFPSIRLPIEDMPKDYWQEEDTGHIKETEGFPLPPVDEEGKPLDYVWVPSTSLHSLTDACNRMSSALEAAESLEANGGLMERGHARLSEAQKELRVLLEKDKGDREKAIAAAAKLAKKLKKKGKSKKKK